MIDVFYMPLHLVMHSAGVSFRTLHCLMQAELMIGGEKTSASKELITADEPVLMGIMAEMLPEKLAKKNIKVPFLEFPALSPQDSDKRKTFREDLRKAVEPGVAEGTHDD